MHTAHEISGAARLHPGAATLRVLAALLAYPDARLRGQLFEMAALIDEDGALSVLRRAEIAALVSEPLGPGLDECPHRVRLHLGVELHAPGAWPEG